MLRIFFSSSSIKPPKNSILKNKNLYHQKRSIFKNKNVGVEIDTQAKSLSAKSLHDSHRAVQVALMGNSLNTVIKLGAFLVTGSGTILSEVFHSAADTCNQALLLLGIRGSNRPASSDFPYGFGNSRFVFALISAVGFFFLGCGASLYGGINALFEPNELADLGVGLAVIGISCIIESYSFTRGLLAVISGAKETGMTFLDYVKKGPDPMGVSVMLEDGAALISLTIASICLSLSYVTGNATYDAVGSILIGLLLGNIAMFLIYKNSSALIGRSVNSETQDKIISVLTDDDAVSSLHNVKAVSLGPNTVRFKADIEFAGDFIAAKYLSEELIQQVKLCKTDDELRELLKTYGQTVVEGLGDEVDRLERNIRQKVPEAKFLDLESN